MSTIVNRANVRPEHAAFHTCEQSFDSLDDAKSHAAHCYGCDDQSIDLYDRRVIVEGARVVVLEKHDAPVVGEDREVTAFAGQLGVVDHWNETTYNLGLILSTGVRVWVSPDDVALAIDNHADIGPGECADERCNLIRRHVAHLPALDFDTAEALGLDGTLRSGSIAEQVAAAQSGVTRYLLVEVDLPDGSGDPERTHQSLMGEVSEFVSGDPRVADVSVTQAYPGDVVAEDDLPEQDSTLDGAAQAAGDLLAAVLGDHMTAMHVGGHFSCTEAENIAGALIKLGQMDAAGTFLVGHATGEEDGDDSDHPTIDAADDPDAAARDYLSL